MDRAFAVRIIWAGPICGKLRPLYNELCVTTGATQFRFHAPMIDPRVLNSNTAIPLGLWSRNGLAGLKAAGRGHPNGAQKENQVLLAPQTAKAPDFRSHQEAYCKHSVTLSIRRAPCNVKLLGEISLRSLPEMNLSSTKGCGPGGIRTESFLLIVTQHSFQITGAVKHANDLDSLRQRRIEDHVVAYGKASKVNC